MNAIRPTSSESVTPDANVFNAAPALFLTDIDGTLLHEGNDHQQPGLEFLKERLARRGNQFLWGVATGRRLELVRRVFETHDLPAPDVVIASVGVEIHFDLSGNRLDTDWTRHIDHRWDTAAVRAAATPVPGLTPQAPASQHRFKVSFQIDGRVFRKADLEKALGPLVEDTQVIITRNTHLDLLPRRASKGLAIQHLCQRWGIAAGNLLVAGDSGNDFDMLSQAAMAIIVGNHSDELEPLRGRRGAYFSPHPATLGVLDGFRHFGFPRRGAPLRPLV